MRYIILAASSAALFWAAWQADACHVAAELRFRSDLTAEQKRLATHGGLKNEPIPYHLKAATACQGGTADIFPCANIDLLEVLPLSSIGGGSGNDIWGWTDSTSGREFALVGRSTGTSFVEVTDPENPIYLGNLPTASVSSAWRDIKVYQDHAFVVADWADNHGIQIFDLKQLLTVAEPPQTFADTAHYGGLARSHNIVINEETGIGYGVGGDTCSGGLHMLDLKTPTDPQFLGCFAADGYTHDAQCVVYKGPDVDYHGKEICLAANEDTVSVIDVDDKASPVLISSTTYEGRGYTHQGWLTEDHAFYVLDDETDELNQGGTTRTYLWDLTDLDAPSISQVYNAKGESIDHNQYVKGNYTYQANYRRGLRVLRLPTEGAPGINEVAYFDTYPESDSNSFSGAWSVYPYFPSGTVVVGDINRGLFILRPDLDEVPPFFTDGFETGDFGRWSDSVSK